MKKTLMVVLLFLLISSVLCADTSWTWNPTDGFTNAGAATKVSLNTTDTIQAEIGFTTSTVAADVSGYKNIADYTPVEGEVVLSAFDSNTGKVRNNQSSIRNKIICYLVASVWTEAEYISLRRWAS